ncbi:glycosyltransferase family 25 protein [Dothistroma septosporum NZE10]|uniref:Glycosyltransferase family 25 protein n=1 Tax=Dothistroma septosporum (strain NZE10 / CBS 128990) TaxID=675120 RepID=M2WKG2_DOTSN|nr:glycosyltransferase family 25 protein [Dothistroma septosporum NZE10]
MLMNRSFSTPAIGRTSILVLAGLILITILTFAHPSPRLIFPALRGLADSRKSVKNDSSSGQGDLLDDVLNATLGFEKIFVVNLPLRSDHRDAVSLAAHFTELQINYVDGVTEVDSRAFPPWENGTDLGINGLKSWRAHMNIMRRMVEENISSALILEDDADWDLRIKTQLHTFARASRVLIQPIRDTGNQFLDSSYPIPSDGRGPEEFNITSNYGIEDPTSSPYGDLDRWDALWLGHCGSDFPSASDEKVPIGRVVIPNDETVPENVNKEFGGEGIFAYPPRTRVVSRAWQTTCTIAYAITLPMARRILYEQGVWKITGPYDMMLRSMCHGSESRRTRTCLGVQPALFAQHKPVGNMATFSNIDEHREGINDISQTPNVVLSTRVNFAKLIEGETDYIKSF